MANGAKQLVVQLALETMSMSDLYSCSLTPTTNMGASLLGAEIITFLAPPYSHHRSSNEIFKTHLAVSPRPSSGVRRTELKLNKSNSNKKKMTRKNKRRKNRYNSKFYILPFLQSSFTNYAQTKLPRCKGLNHQQYQF